MNNITFRPKTFRDSRKNMLTRVITIVVVVVLLTTGIVFASYSDDVSQGLANNLIRLHVIANSDSKEDQALKRDIRDIIINYMKGQLKGSKDIGHTKNIINSDLKKIEELAKKEIVRQGKNYPVKSMLGVYSFPTKAYGDVTLPAGNYQALRVVIGKGEGANWWCVLFPPLCFVDATHGTVPDTVKDDLKRNLSEDQYQIITSTQDDIPVKVKFKIVEFFEDSKVKFSGLMGRIFSAIK
jgi:stage II sporulation protein R